MSALAHEELVIPYKVNWKAFAPVIILFLLNLVMIWLYVQRGVNVALPCFMGVLLAWPMVAAALRSGKPFITYGRNSLRSPLIPRELENAILYRDIQEAWVVSRKGMSYLCLRLRDPDRILAALTPKRRRYFQQGFQDGRGSLYMPVTGLAVDPQYLCDQLRVRLPGGENASENATV